MNRLLTNIGRRTYIVKYFEELKKKYKLNIYLLDSSKFVPSFKVSKITKNFVSPRASSKEKYSKYLKNFVNKKKINLIFPLSNWEMSILADLKNYFKKKNIEAIVSEKKVIKTCLNKLLTIKKLRTANLDYPKVVNFNEIKKNLPVIKKRIKGRSSIDQEIISSVKNISSSQKGFFYQKYLKFPEFGMDILNDLNGNFLHCCVRKKLLMRAGDTDKAQIVKSKLFLNLAKKISKTFKHIGILDIDFLMNKNKIYILDLNPRIGGGYPFTHEFGYNYLEKIICLVLNKEYKIEKKIKKFNTNKIFTKGISIHRH